MNRAIVFVWCVVAACVAHAHGGAMDTNGCHESKRIGYHCHPVKKSKASALKKKERILERCRAGYLPKDSAECRMAVDAPESKK